ncbi:G2/mitotic-specific cyclin-B-like [Tropilaelaps mercedesae]|uniref:G2/mitotic-specific cyclin-B-like n=1 Tax=Tropilaelaps mercedesae TaxID=418985 RepID=A0A1V9XSI4_9ACAR|nr:G2/mitotic-specific cyclin-B-like [Tropilaelaps mercedesae]
MALQQRSQVNENRENLQVSSSKPRLGKCVLAGPRRALSTLNTNIAVVSHEAKVESQLQAAPLKDFGKATQQPKVERRNVEPLPVRCLPIKPLPLPADVVDIDIEDADYLEFSTEYVKDIYEYLFRLETQFAVKPQYLVKHPALQEHMRMVLVEWLVSLQVRFGLLQETLLTAVAILDRFMSSTGYEISRTKFQLVGVTCMLVACKYEETYSPSLADFAFMCDGAYTVQDLIRMERVILTTLHFELAKPLTAHFLRRFSKAAGADSTTHVTAKYLLELALYEYSLVHCKPSAIAAAALWIAGAVTNAVEWNKTMVAYSRYQALDLEFIAAKIAELATSADSNKYVRATYRKYASEKFQHVSRTLSQSAIVLELADKSRDSNP